MLKLWWGGECVKNRIIIAGSRWFTDYSEAKKFITSSIVNFQMGESWILLSGRCKGADQLGERFARENGWPIEEFPADWRKYGRAAGPIRNQKMVDTCDAIICFWDGKSKGTASLIRYARKTHKPLHIKSIGK